MLDSNCQERRNKKGWFEVVKVRVIQRSYISSLAQEELNIFELLDMFKLFSVRVQQWQLYQVSASIRFRDFRSFDKICKICTQENILLENPRN